MIYLMPDPRNPLGEDIFWQWALREFPNSVLDTPTRIAKDDVLIRYSTHPGPIIFPESTITMLWDMQYELKRVLQSNAWDEVLTVIDRAGFSSAKLTGYSSLMTPYYAHYNKPIDILPIGIDVDLFKPQDKRSMRARYGLPEHKRIGIWYGFTHPMKGFDRLCEYSRHNPEVFWIVVWRSEEESASFEGKFSRFVNVRPQQFSELLSSADFFLASGRLRPFHMSEWEAMACNTPLVILDGMQKDFVPSPTPRDDIFRLGWDRPTAKKTWLNYINQFIASKNEDSHSNNDLPCVPVLRHVPSRRPLR